jgi:hypothetical protein
MELSPRKTEADRPRATTRRVGMYLNALCSQSEFGDAPNVQLYDSRIKPLAQASMMLAEDEILMADCLRYLLGMTRQDDAKPLIDRLKLRIKANEEIVLSGAVRN